MNGTHLYNPEIRPSERLVPMPPATVDGDRQKVSLQKRGFYEVAQLVHTGTGGTRLISVEGQVESGNGAARALSQVRPDGHPAFMRPAEWERLPEADRAAMVDAPKAPDHSYDTSGSLVAKVLERDDEIRKLNARLAELEAVAKGKR